MLKAVIEKHTAAILMTFQYQLQTGIVRAVFGPPGVVTRIMERELYISASSTLLEYLG